VEPEQVIRVIIFLNIVLKRKRKRRNRKLWVHPILTFRLTNRAFYTLFGEPGKEKMSFFN
jgi:hypothetical protein